MANDTIFDMALMTAGTDGFYFGWFLPPDPGIGAEETWDGLWAPGSDRGRDVDRCGPRKRRRRCRRPAGRDERRRIAQGPEGGNQGGKKGGKGGKPLAGTMAPVPAFDMQIPIFYITEEFSEKDRETIRATAKLLTDDDLSIGAPFYKEVPKEPLDRSLNLPKEDILYPVSVSRMGNGPHKVGTELLRSLQEPKTKVILTATKSALPGAQERNNRGEVFYECDLVGKLIFFTRPFSTPATDPKGSVVEESPLAIVMGHEFVHASHFVRDRPKDTTKDENTFYDGIGNFYKESRITEEMMTTGLGRFANEKFCENSIRKEQGQNARVSYASPFLKLDDQVIVPPNPLPAWWPWYPGVKRPKLVDVRIDELEILNDQSGWWTAGNNWTVDFVVNKQESASKKILEPQNRSETKKAYKGQPFKLGWIFHVFIDDVEDKEIKVSLTAGTVDKAKDVVQFTLDKSNGWSVSPSTIESTSQKLFKARWTVTAK
jgi:hypothetical protein